MNTAIEFYSKSVYGEWKMYVKDEDMAAKLGAVTHCKTLTEHDKSAFEALGFAFTEVIAPR